MDYDAILKKMNLLYFEGKLQTSQTQPTQPPQPAQPPQPKMTREQYIQLQKQRLIEKRRVQQEQFQKRKLLMTNITTSSSLKQMNISKFG
jgi:hypothetical protein